MSIERKFDIYTDAYKLLPPKKKSPEMAGGETQIRFGENGHTNGNGEGRAPRLLCVNEVIRRDKEMNPKHVWETMYPEGTRGDEPRTPVARSEVVRKGTRGATLRILFGE